MKHRILCAALAIAMLAIPAYAESLSAVREGDALNITWDAEGECTLTVYRNSWPVRVCNVRGADGGLSVAIDEGKYSVRLRTPKGCLTADAEVCADPSQCPEKTSAPSAKPTVAPTEAPSQSTAKPTIKPTTNPTAVPTVKPTTKPTAIPTVKPTTNPTAIPTVNPTTKPTAAPTAIPTVNPTAKPTVAPTAIASDDLAAQVIAEVNAERAKYGLPALRTDSELTRAACVRANEIVQSFSHTRPSGESWSTVSSAARGENIAKGHSSVARVMAAWMSSEGHRANILRESFGSIGVCVVESGGVRYWVQLFGR